MNGIVIIAHAPLASALRQCVLHVFPEQADTVVAVDVQADASPEKSIEQANQAAAAFDSVLLLTDVLGATPSNVARALLADDGKRRLVAGVNLPMLLRAVSYRNEELDDWMSYALLGGSQGVQRVD